MKMFNKEGDCMVDVKKMFVDGTDIVMTCKLMDAYSMNVYLHPDQLRQSLTMVNFDLIKALPEILIKDTMGEDQLRAIGENLKSKAGDPPALLLGEEGVEKFKKAGAALGLDTAETLVNTLLQLLPVLLANKPGTGTEKKKR